MTNLISTTIFIYVYLLILYIYHIFPNVTVLSNNVHFIPRCIKTCKVNTSLDEMDKVNWNKVTLTLQVHKHLGISLTHLDYTTVTMRKM